MKQMLSYLEKTQEKAFWVSALQVVMASIFLALIGQVKIPLPFSPVPIILQSKMVLVIAALLGARRGVIATLLFLAYGAFGLPVFASGTYGYLSFFGPTGGYILAYPLAVYFVGALTQKSKTINMARVFFLFSVAMFAIIYPLGCLQLSWFVGAEKALLLGAAPFALTDAILLFVLASMSLPAIKKIHFKNG